MGFDIVFGKDSRKDVTFDGDTCNSFLEFASFNDSDVEQFNDDDLDDWNGRGYLSVDEDNESGENQFEEKFIEVSQDDLGNLLDYEINTIVEHIADAEARETNVSGRVTKADIEISKKKNVAHETSSSRHDVCLKGAVSRNKKRMEAPKKPLSAYNIFFQHERRLLFQQNRDDQPDSSKKRGGRKIGFQELGKIIGKRWKELPIEERRKFSRLSCRDIIRYRKEIDLYELKRRQRIVRACDLKQSPVIAKREVGCSIDKNLDKNSLLHLISYTGTLMDKTKPKDIDTLTTNIASQPRNIPTANSLKHVGLDSTITPPVISSSVTLPQHATHFPCQIVDEGFRSQLSSNEDRNLKEVHCKANYSPSGFARWSAAVHHQPEKRKAQSPIRACQVNDNNRQNSIFHDDERHRHMYAASNNEIAQMDILHAPFSHLVDAKGLLPSCAEELKPNIIPVQLPNIVQVLWPSPDSFHPQQLHHVTYKCFRMKQVDAKVYMQKLYDIHKGHLAQFQRVKSVSSKYFTEAHSTGYSTQRNFLDSNHRPRYQGQISQGFSMATSMW